MTAVPGRLFSVRLHVIFLAIILACPPAAAQTIKPLVCGRVVDSEGRPVQQATLKLLAAKPSGLLIPDFVSFGSITGQTNSDGEFAFRIAADDPRFLCGSIFDRLTLLCYAPGFELQYKKFPITRFFVDAPIEFQLSQARRTQVTLVDSDGHPLRGVEVRPATIATASIPFEEAADFAQVSDANGQVEFSGISPLNLKRIYVSGDSIGSQCLDVSGSADDETTLTATALQTRRVAGRVSVEASEFYDPPQLDSIEVTFQTKPELEGTEFCFVTVSSQADGSFELPNQCSGITTFIANLSPSMPYAFEYSRALQNSQPDESTISLTLKPATLVVGQVKSSTTDAGIPSLYVKHFAPDNRISFTGNDGQFQFWALSDRTSPPFVSDGFGRFLSSATVRRDPYKLPASGRLELAPQFLSPMSQTVGKVVDEQEKPVAGVSVEVEYTANRYSLKHNVYTNLDGTFRFFGVPENARVSITASNDRLSSLDKQELLLDAGAQPHVIVHRLPLNAFRGRVISHHGTPVSGASILFFRAQDVRPESFEGLDRTTRPLFEEGLVSYSDEDGNFVSPPMPKAGQDVAFRVSAPGYRTFNHHWTDYSTRASESQTIELGEVRLASGLKTVPVRVRVIDAATGSSIQAPRVVFLGARTGIMKSTMSAESEVLRVQDGQQIVAAIAIGYLPEIRVLASVPSDLELALKPDTNAPEARMGASYSMSELRAFARQLLVFTSEPSSQDTFYRKLAYYASYGFAHPELLPERVRELKQQGENSTLLEYVEGMSLGHLPIEVLKQLAREDAQPQQRLLVLRTLASRTEGEEAANYRSAAIEIARTFSKDELLSEFSRLACSLLDAGLFEQAEALLAEGWQRDPSLEELLNAGERIRGRSGTASYFLPEYAMVNRRKAMKLIELTAVANQTQSLRSQAIVFLASRDKPGWELAAEAFLPDGINASAVARYTEKLSFRNVESGRRLAALLPNSSAKAAFYLHLAEHGSDLSASERAELAYAALEVYRGVPAVAHEYPCHEVAAACQLVAQWDPRLAEQFAFESLWMCENDYTQMPFYLTSGIASNLASYDSKLARALLEPCFDDWSWLFSSDDRDMFYRSNMPLAAAAAVDPPWAIELAEQLIENQLAGRISRHHATVNAITAKWCEMCAE